MEDRAELPVTNGPGLSGKTTGNGPLSEKDAAMTTH